jgi:outer membrane murein-binding lipoprotein Lpp
MSYRWHTLALSLLVVAALAARTAAQGTDSLKQTDSQKLDEMLRQLRDLKAAVDSLARVRADLKSFQTQEELRGERLSERIDRVNDRIGGLENRIKRLESDLEAMRAPPTTANRISGYSPQGNGAPPPAAGPQTGTVRLRNDCPYEVSMVVNGLSYQLAPGEVRMTTQPAGPLTYEVLGGRVPRRVTGIAPGEQVTLFAYP